MWARIMETKNGYTADVWRELFNNCALSVRVVAKDGAAVPSESGECEIYVPWGKTHVAEEILRKS
jgi:hypothetical protein